VQASNPRRVLLPPLQGVSVAKRLVSVRGRTVDAATGKVNRAAVNVRRLSPTEFTVRSHLYAAPFCAFNSGGTRSYWS
jgi:hypothetical protein